jgi:hypothetical protein
VVEAQETSTRVAVLRPAGFGVRTIDHFVPFHRSARVCTSPEAAWYEPTDQQSPPVRQLTDDRLALAEPAGDGVVCRRQVEPVSSSVSGREDTVLVPKTPTARQFDVETHDTPSR